jgi:hypothetical protein
VAQDFAAPRESAIGPMQTSNSSCNCYVYQMRTLQDVTKFVGEQPLMMALLRAIATLDIDDCWIGAGRHS